MTPANDNLPRRTTAAIPLAIRLARASRKEDIRRLISYGTVVTVPSWLSAESNLPEAGRPLADRVIEIRPSPDEMVAIAARDAIAVSGVLLRSYSGNPKAGAANLSQSGRMIVRGI